MGYSVLPAGKKDQLMQYFVTVERDPSVETEAGKEQLRHALEELFTRRIIAKLAIVAEEGKTGYKHYHAILKLREPMRWVRANDKLKKLMHFEKEKGKHISTWWGKGRNGDVDIYGDWMKYITRPGVKQKEIDENGVMHLEEDAAYEAWLARGAGWFGSINPETDKLDNIFEHM